MIRTSTKKRVVFLLTAIFVVSAFLIYYNMVSLPVIKTYTAAKTRALTERAVNLAVSNVINRTLNYDKLIDITYSGTGEIVSFSANQYEINSITREIVKEAQAQMQLLGEDGLKLNIGTFTGMPYLIGRGPEVVLKLVPIGAVQGVFSSEFDSVGINMTRHSLFLTIEARVNIVMPVKSYDYLSSNQVLLAESIIIGKVPEVYLNGLALGKNMNLVPN